MSKWRNLPLQPLVISGFSSLSLHYLPPVLPPFFSSSSPNRGPSDWLLIYKCLCVLKSGTKEVGLWPLVVPTLRRFFVRRWERGFWTETPAHWPTHTYPRALPFMCAPLHVAPQLSLFQWGQWGTMVSTIPSPPPFFSVSFQTSL